MELYLDPVWVKPKKERKPHPLKGQHQWPTDDPEKRARILEGLKKGQHSKNKGCSPKRFVPVAVYDLAGNFVSVHVSVSDAARKYSLSQGNICETMKRQRGRVGQFQFRKANVVEFQGEKLVKKTPIEPYKRSNRKSNLITN